MKRLLTCFSAMAIAVIMCFSVSGCTFRKDNGSIEDLANSVNVSQNVEIKNYSEAFDLDGVVSTREKMDIEDAIEKVCRSSVAISTESGSGTGVLIKVSVDNKESDKMKTAYIITCHHVISGKGVINVTIPDTNYSYENKDYIFGGVIGSSVSSSYYISDKTTMDNAVTLVGSDETSDIAVLKLDLTKRSLSGKILSASNLCFATVPPADCGYSPRLGETIFSVGNPTGSLPGSVCKGIISYLERKITVDDVGEMTLLQIDAPTNPGVSGGGLYNLYGELIGITNAGNTSYNSINFAIPMTITHSEGEIDNGFVNIAEQLIGTYNSLNGENYGYISGRKAKIGMTVTKGASDDGEYIYVYEITQGSVAEKAGLKAGDTFTGVYINNTKVDISTYSKFTTALNGLKIGDELKVEVTRIINNHFSTQKTFTFKINQYIFCDTGVYVNN